MWNFWSLPKWHYSVPLVQAFHIFEMPVLGYAGYLPFGLECFCLFALVRHAFPCRALDELCACGNQSDRRGALPHTPPGNR